MKSRNLLRGLKQIGYARVLAICLSFIVTLLISYSHVWGQTPVAANGQLSVSGTQLVNEQGIPIKLRGMSTHGLQWYGHCVNYDAISALANDWGADVLRLAMYPDESGSGWVYDKEYYNGFIDELVGLTEQFGIYCIIDWHVHVPGDPMSTINEAKEFWELMSSRYANKEHIIYEICNEPNGVNWSRISEYANQIIPIIRANDPDQVILVGTPSYSQDVDIASQNPLQYDNLLYSLHFYAGTHGQSLRNKANTAISNGIGLFITEWGTSNADGNGGPFPDNANVWIDWANENNLSWCNWSFADKNEASAALAEGSCVGNEWNNTSPSGTYVKDIMLNPADSWENGGNIPPTAAITSPDPQAKFELNETVIVEASATDQDGTVTLVEFYANGNRIGESSTAPYSAQFVANEIGAVELSLKVTDDSGATNNSNIISIEILEEIIQVAYPDSVPHEVPGEINATHFDYGGEGIAYHDVDATNKGGFNRNDEGVDTEPSENGNIGYIVKGEWYEYTIDVSTAGKYTIEIRVASEPGGGEFYLEFDGVDKTGIQNVPATGGWTSYTTHKIDDVELASGEQVMRLFVETGDFNYATMTFTYTGTSVLPTGVTVSPTELTLNAGESSDLEETVLPSNATNKNVTWSTSNSDIATVSSEGLVTAVSEGQATITVTTQEGGFSASSQITVAPAPIIEVTGVELDITFKDLYPGDCFQLTENVLPENATNKNVYWSSSDSNIATVSSTGLVCAVNVGTAVITVETADNGFTASCEIRVLQKPEDQYTLTVSVVGGGADYVQVDPEQDLYNYGTEVKLTALQPDNGTEFIGWSGDASGTDLEITILMDGNKEITATYKPVSECTPISMPFVQKGKGDLCFIAKGTIKNINSWNMDYVEVNGSDFTNVYASGNKIPASGDGIIHIKYSASVDWAHFEINGDVENEGVPVTGVSISPTVASIEVNKSVTLTKTVTPSNATDQSVSWKSSNTGIATVNGSGVVAGLAEGVTIISVTTEDGGFVAQCEVTVVDNQTDIAVSGVRVSPTQASIEEGGTIALSETVEPSNATYQSVSWGSSNISVATVNGSGVVTGVAEGTAIITVTTDDGGFVASSEVTVIATQTDIPVTGVSISPIQAAINVGETIAFSETVEPSNATDQSVNWSSNNTDVLTIDDSGIATGIAEGVAIITITTTDGGYTSEAEVTVKEGGSNWQPCEGPLTISVPIKVDGAGEFCWFTTDDISYINSWSLDVLEINGVGNLNTYSTDFPPKVDGGYYIYYAGSKGWSHFEASGTKTTEGTNSFVDVQVFPNPFEESTRLFLRNVESVNNIIVLDQIGRVVLNYSQNELTTSIKIGENLKSGLYYVKVISSHNNQTMIITKK